MMGETSKGGVARVAVETPGNTATFETVVLCGERGKLGLFLRTSVSWLRYQVGRSRKAI